MKNNDLSIRIYETNKTALLKNQSDLLGIFSDKEFNPFELVPAKNGMLTSQIHGKFIHSRYDPLKESERFIEEQGLNEGDFVVLYGIGLGYHLRPILNQIGPEGFLYVIELNQSLLKTALYCQDLSKELEDPRVKIITGRYQEEVAQAFDHYICWGLDSIPDEKKKVIIHGMSLDLIPDEFSWIRNSLEIIKLEKQGDSLFYEEMKNNLRNNLETVLSSPGIESLSPAFKDSPVIFAGAGPTLDQAAPLIRRVQQRAWIVCVDTAVIPLHEYGICPDLIISVDPQQKSSDNFVSCENKMTPIIMLPTSASDVVQKVTGLKIMAVQKGSWVSDFFNHRLDFLGLTYGGGAVSVIGMDILLRLAKGPLLLAGMDFSFPRLKSYANFSPEFNKWQSRTGPYFTLEMASIENVFSRKTVFVENFYQSHIPTFQTMYSYLRSLETILQFYKRNDVYMLYPEGAKIKGVSPLFFEEETDKLLSEPFSKLIRLENPHHPPELLSFCREKIKSLTKTRS
ncbi:MAG: motility associated factor glycosyltransferase family protein [Candidatus Aureabacteria bacterium]|nr:motility associated factor glycosyltransferase family protein [Candidatus Auribacterota bacterium]